MRSDARRTRGARVAPRRRDRRGRGVRGLLTPAEMPAHRTRGERFDELVMDAVEELEEHWAAELTGLEFAVQDVPPDVVGAESAPEVVADRGVPLGRLLREGTEQVRSPVAVIYRRPIEARAADPEDRADLVFMVVVDLVAEFLGRDADELDPPGGAR